MRILLSSLLLFYCISTYAQNANKSSFQDIVYTAHQDPYSIEKCRLDLYIPEGEKDFVTLIWFHGGGLTSGQKEIPPYLKNKGIAIVGVGYRLAPKTKVTHIIEDAADAVQWTFDHIEKYGGNKHKIIIGGYSAGAYIALMLGLNPSYLKAKGLDTHDLLGIISFSAQTITHFTARHEIGREGLQPSVDELAPLYWVRKDAPPIMLITGDRELEMMGRYEENAYLWRMLKLAGHQEVKLFEIEGYGHDMTYPAYPLLMKQIQQWNK